MNQNRKKIVYQIPTQPYRPYHIPIRSRRKFPYPLTVGLAVLILLACIVNLGLGISLLLFSVPVYIRAANSSFQKVLAGGQLSTSYRVQAFVSSVVVVGVCAIAGGIGFFATCVGVLVVGSTDAGFIENILHSAINEVPPQNLWVV